MKSRIKVLTLGVRDLERSLVFDRDGMGLPTSGIVGQQFEDGAVDFFNMNDGLIVALYPTASLAKDANIPRPRQGSAQCRLGTSSDRDKRLMP